MSDNVESPQLACGKCGGTMEEGFLLDHSHMVQVPSEWVEGPPVRSFWSGFKADVRRKVVTFRCTECGHLESYARG